MSVWELHEDMRRLCIIISMLPLLEVGSADRATEESVAGEGYTLVLDVERRATHRVSWCFDYLDVV